MSLTTTRLFTREVEDESCRRRHHREKLETTESEDPNERGLQLERKLASIRRSTRHLRDKLAAEHDELEAARVKNATSFAASHQYLPQPPAAHLPQTSLSVSHFNFLKTSTPVELNRKLGLNKFKSLGHFYWKSNFKGVEMRNKG